MRRKNKPHSYGRLSTFEQAALVFRAVESGPHSQGWKGLNTIQPDCVLGRKTEVTCNWFQTGKRVRQGCILSPCLFNLYVTQDLSSWQGGSGVCRPCVCGTWA